jgi:hypothetical protein
MPIECAIAVEAIRLVWKFREQKGVDGPQFREKGALMRFVVDVKDAVAGVGVGG